MDQIVAELLTCLDNPFLAMQQWDEVFSVVEVSPLQKSEQYLNNLNMAS